MGDGSLDAEQDRPPRDNSVRFRLLGPLEVTVGGRAVRLGGLRSRAVMAMLLTADGASVSEDTLTDTLWGEDPPASARNSLQTHVSRLRAALNAAGGNDLASRLRRDAGGYRLDTHPDEVDVSQVEALLARARSHAAGTAGRDGAAPGAGEAADLLARAAACWRGPALADFQALPGWHASGLSAVRARLDELRGTVDEELQDTQLRAGRHAEALPALQQAASRYPLREGIHRLLAVALYRCGRPTDALQALRRYRQRLIDEAGLDPADDLDVLEQRILSRDPALAAPPAVAPPAPPDSDAAISAPAPEGDPALQVPPHLYSAAPFVGRERELAWLAAAVPGRGLVTITGPGGVGKTRLAMEALARPRDAPGEAVVLELAPVRRVDAVVPALAGVLGLRSSVSQPLDAAVIDYLGSQRLVLVIDNCEHLLESVADLVHRVLARSPGVTVLATSRARLRVKGERVLPLGPLAVPHATGPTEPAGAVEAGGDTAAVRLFADRATRTRPTFAMSATTRPIVDELCRRLDGLPLAIELAAGQLGALGLADLRDRLDDRLDLLVGTGAWRSWFGPQDHEEPDDGARTDDTDTTRHATLRAVVDWSYALLSADQRNVFETLSVFDGGFTLDAAERVAMGTERSTADLVARLTRLVDASLIVATVTHDGRMRYTMLETLRAYAAERLAARGAAADARGRHVAWVVDLVEEAEARLMGPDEHAWAHRIGVEFPNVRSAWQHAADCGDTADAARMSIALSGYAHWHGTSELWLWARRLADRADLAGTPLGPAVLGAAAHAAYLQGDLDETERLARAGLDDGDRTPEQRRWWCEIAVHVLAMYRGAYERAERLARDITDAPATPPFWRLVLLGNIALARLYRGDVEAARAAVAPCRRAAREIDCPTGHTWAAYVDGEVALIDDPTRALAVLQDAVTRARSLGNTFVEGVAAVALVSGATRAHDHAVALRRFPEAIRHWRRSGMWVQQWTTMRILAELLVDLGVDDAAAVLLAAADAADDAPAVVAADADRRDRLWHTLRTRLGDSEVTRLTGRGSAMDRTEVVEYALDQALAARDRTAPA